jgi:hypothetical protein
MPTAISSRDGLYSAALPSMTVVHSALAGTSPAASGQKPSSAHAPPTAAHASAQL